MILSVEKAFAVTRLLAPLLVFICCRPALATDITLLAGYQFNSDFEIVSANDLPANVEPGTGEPGDDVELDDSAAFSLAVDFVFEQQQTKRIGFYISHAQTRFESNAGLSNRDLDVTHVHFTAMAYYPDGKLEPFVLAGIGAGFFSPKDSSLKDETKFSAQIGAGTNYRFSESLLLRVDVRWLATFFDSSGAAFCSGGCTIAVSSDTYSQVQANIGLMYRF
jgi:opacity protein-like surface antigen